MSFVRELFGTVGLLVEEHGIAGLALLPFCHIGYVDERDKRFVNVPVFEKVVKDRSELPEGAIETKTRKDGEYLGTGHLVQNDGEDWIASVHTDGPTVAWSGGWPYVGKKMVGSADLNREQADALAKKTFTG